MNQETLTRSHEFTPFQCPVALEMLPDGGRRLHDFWAGLSRNGDHKLPWRCSFLAEDIPPDLLPNLIVVANDNERDWTVRLAGTRVCEIEKRDITGLVVNSDTLGPAGQMFEDSYNHCIHEAAPLSVGGNLVWTDNSHMSFLQINLPMLGRRGIGQLVLIHITYGPFVRRDSFFGN